MLTLEIFEELLTEHGQAALRMAQSLDLRPAARLASITELRRHVPALLAAAALEMALLREHARTKFARGAELYWTREALEQASGEVVAAHRATRYRDWPDVVDLCCSVGGDLLELARAEHHVTGVDHDPLRLALAETNAAVYGISDRVDLVAADVRGDVPLAPVLFFDPGRRSGARRIFNPDDYRPPLSTIERWLPRIDGLGVKVAPGIPYDDLPWECEVEVVSVGGEVKEAVLWFGALRRGRRTATLLPGGATIQWAEVPPVPVVAPLRFLVEPDRAVIRAHLVEQLADRLNAAKIDGEIAFLTVDHAVATPFARVYEIIETLPFNLKQIRARLRSLGIGHVIVKTRGSPIDPQEFEKQLRLAGDNTATVVLTRALDRPIAIICRPMEQDRRT